MSKTVEEISRDTGLSVTTIRLVINGQADRYRISARTQKKVADYIAEHGFVLNHVARSLKLRRSDAIGFVVPDLANAFFARLMAALEKRCRDRGLVLLTSSSHEEPELESRAVSSLLARGVDGVVIAPCQVPRASMFARKSGKTAVVVVDRAYEQEAYPTVVSDNYESGRRLAEKVLAESGAQAFFLAARSDLPSIVQRIRGFVDACSAAGLTDAESRILHDAEDSVGAGRRMMTELLGRCGEAPRAFVCSSLLVLEGALEELKAHRGEIPRDVIIATFDTHAMLDFLPNRVFSIRQDEEELADRAFQCLIEQLNGDTVLPARYVVPCELLSR